MRPQAPLRDTERANWDFFLAIPELDRREISNSSVRQMQVQQPLFEFSGRLRRLRRDALHQAAHAAVRRPAAHRQRDRLLLDLRRQSSDDAYTQERDGRGPAWANSLFEDNAEFGLGFRVSLDKQQEFAGELLQQLAPQVGRRPGRRKS